MSSDYLVDEAPPLTTGPCFVLFPGWRDSPRRSGPEGRPPAGPGGLGRQRGVRYVTGECEGVASGDNPVQLHSRGEGCNFLITRLVYQSVPSIDNADAAEPWGRCPWRLLLAVLPGGACPELSRALHGRWTLPRGVPTVRHFSSYLCGHSWVENLTVPLRHD